MPRTNNQESSERVPASVAKHIVDEMDDYVNNEKFRKRVKEIFEDCVGQITFKDKIKEFAGEAFNDRLFRNGWAIVIFLLTLIAAGIIGRLFK